MSSTPGLSGRLFHLTSLVSLAIAAPVLDLVARHAEFLVAHRLDSRDVLVLIAALLLGPVVPMAVMELGLGLISRRAANAIYVAFIALLVFLLVLPISGRLGVHGLGALGLAAAVGCGTAIAYRRRPAIRLLVSFLGVALIGVPFTFLRQPKIQSFLSTPQESAGWPKIGTETPIVFLIFDEFGLSPLIGVDGLINRHRYPNFAQLADQSTWFLNVETVAYSTERAVPAIVTGRTPSFDRLPSVTDHPENLFTLFARSHEVFALEPITSLCPPEINHLSEEGAHQRTPLDGVLADLGVVYLHVVVPRPFKRRLPPIDMGWRDFAHRKPAKKLFEDWGGFHRQARRKVASTEGRLDSIGRFLNLLETPPTGGMPPLYFKHILLPHRPFEFLPDGKQYWTDSPAGLEGQLLRLQGSELESLLSLQRYILQLQFVDRTVGDVMRRLRTSGLFDPALIVLVADHGTSFQPGRDSRSLARGADPAEVLPVPLWIKLPYQVEGAVVGTTVRTIDVLPTILDILGADPPWTFDGRSALVQGPARDPLRIETPDGFLEYGPEIHRLKILRARSVLERFGSGEDPTDLYRIGPHPELVGSRVSAWPRRSLDGWSAAIVEPDRFRQIDDGASVVPALLSGSLEVPHDVGDGCCALAIALDGVVQTTVATADREIGRVFSTLLPPSGLEPGRHRLEILVLLDQIEGLALAPVEIESAGGFLP
ncbi:MAG: sulfatase-like hydrolase/transferase [Thermoanaerobaculia bacterium]|nr:sulfatase-like hydrolase/transferase [Thermoanaerobaculia bacterium]